MNLKPHYESLKSLFGYSISITAWKHELEYGDMNRYANLKMKPSYKALLNDELRKLSKEKKYNYNNIQDWLWKHDHVVQRIAHAEIPDNTLKGHKSRKDYKWRVRRAYKFMALRKLGRRY